MFFKFSGFHPKSGLYCFKKVDPGQIQVSVTFGHSAAMKQLAQNHYSTKMTRFSDQIYSYFGRIYSQPIEFCKSYWNSWQDGKSVEIVGNYLTALKSGFHLDLTAKMVNFY